ncbi:MAG TPA: XrtA/PEP-CTERM system histidine kinase PrsK [Lacunisphaera sp.]|nr:XrtA/PEP-CTERM system histidine kinase PrsK [Lacunisphaera sp.]
MTLDIIFAYGSAVPGILLALGAAVRAQRNPDRWAFVAGMTALAVDRTFAGFIASAPTAYAAYNWQVWRLSAVSLMPGIWLLFSLTYARGNAAEFLRKWRYGLALAFLVPLVCILFFRSSLLVSTEVASGSLVFRIGAAGALLYLTQLIVAILVLVNLEHTFRAAVGTVRWRIKFILMGVGVLVLVRLFTASQSLLFRFIDPRLDILNSIAMFMAGLLILRSLFRAGHFNLDVHPSQSVLQGSVTILLVGVYLMLVGVLAKVVALLGGDSAFAIKALVVLVLLVLLTVLLQSDRVRLRLRRFVSRHFQRPIHDYRTVWRKFTEGTASRVEQTEYCRAVVRLTADIFEALSVSIWLVDDGREEMKFAASSSLTASQATSLEPNKAEAAAVIRYMRTHPEPVDIETQSEEWAATLRLCHPDEFHKGSSRVCVPVVSGGEVLAIVLLGDRVSGVAFTEQDLDLLKSISDQVGSGLLNVRLSQRLLQAREHEAFQTMAAFFVHDLKNAASTLNLMLQNLPDHFDDPAFREDALRGVGKSVNHINHLISRLSQLRSELKIQPVDSDLNEVVAEVLAAFTPPKDFVVESQPGALPRLQIDREQLGKVVTNLVLNARDACAASGRLCLSTSRSGGWAVLEAVDNGKGIAPEFIANSLFRPFKTTKANGLGIGMFQSKMIIEAHGGRITVESSPGNGTTFRVFLPLTALS